MKKIFNLWSTPQRPSASDDPFGYYHIALSLEEVAPQEYRTYKDYSDGNYCVWCYCEECLDAEHSELNGVLLSSSDSKLDAMNRWSLLSSCKCKKEQLNERIFIKMSQYEK